MVLSGFAFVGVQWFSDSVQTFLPNQANYASASLEASPLVVKIPPVKIDAGAAFSTRVFAGVSSIIFKQDSQRELPIASLTKLMTALVALEHYDTNQIRDVLSSMLIESSNQAAEQLSGMMGQALFVATMNQRAKELGMEHTHFSDSSGLSPESYSSAADIATLSEYLFENYPLFREIVSLPAHGTMTTTNKLLGQDGIIGGKTGYTKEAKGCFMAFRALPDGTYSINVILGADDRFLEMEKLIYLVNK